jgi:hypothetical protein
MRFAMTGRARKADASLPQTLEVVRKDHFVQRMLCRDMESIADGLPDLPALPEVRALCDRIEHVTDSHFERAEAAFATLPDGQRPDPASLAMLRQMHQLDEIHAQDVVAALIQHASEPSLQQVGQLAYMLRCLFDGHRRLIALKESWIAHAELQAPIRSD